MIFTLCSLKIIFVLIKPVPGLIDVHCVVQVAELMHIDILFINIPFLWNTIPFNTSYGAFKSEIKLFQFNSIQFRGVPL